MSIASNLARIRQEIADACRRTGRSDSEVTLMGVSKMQPTPAITEAWRAGLRLFGENRVQEWQQKQSELGNDIRNAPGRPRVHLIGPLQTNKTGKAAELFDGIDAIDSLRIAARVNQSAMQLGKKIPVLVEVKLSPEESKHGILPDELPALLEALEPMQALSIRGLMTVPPWSKDPEVARPYFRQLQELRDLWIKRWPGLTELSMGMSNDFAIAIEEGSTCVRVGTALFGPRPLGRTANG